MVVHLAMDATILKKDSPEELQQQEILKRKKEEQEKRKVHAHRITISALLCTISQLLCARHAS